MENYRGQTAGVPSSPSYTHIEGSVSRRSSTESWQTSFSFSERFGPFQQLLPFVQWKYTSLLDAPDSNDWWKSTSPSSFAPAASTISNWSPTDVLSWKDVE